MTDDPFNEATPEDRASNFFDSGSASCRFSNIGDVHQGKVLAFEETQQRDIKTKAPAVWPDGNPKMMLVITLQTAERDEAIDDDNGERRLYVNKPSGMFAAIKTAIGKQNFAIGGQLAVKYTGNGKSKSPGFNPPKEYVAKYAAPSNGTPPAASYSSSGTTTSAGPTVGQADAQRAAWNAFRSVNPGKSTEEMATDWRGLLADTFHGQDSKSLVQAQWAMLKAKIESGVALGAGVPEDEPPF